MYLEPKIEEYITSHTSPEDELLSELNRQTHLRILNPRMISGAYQGKILEFISRMLKPKEILEIGTFTGYSTICLARGLAQEGHIRTIEINDEVTGFAAEFFRRSGLKKKIAQYNGNALDIIGQLDFLFDLVFIDAEKREYPDYYRLVLPKLKRGGFLIADNVLWNGKVLDESETSDPSTSGVAEFNKMAVADPSVETLMLPVRDGLFLARKK